MDNNMLKFIKIRNSYGRRRIGELSINEQALAEYEKFCLDLIKENEQLKYNWNKLKKYINEANEDLYWTNNYDDILYIMQELEQGSDSNENNNI